MIVTREELDLVNDGKRTLLLLPVERGDDGERLPCPVETERFVKLQPAEFEKGTGVTILDVYRTRAESLTPAEVRLLGESGVFWDGAPEVWAVTFALGNHTAFFEKHRERFLSKSGITTDVERHILEEPGVTRDEEMAMAGRAADRRDKEDDQEWVLAKAKIESAIDVLRERGGGDDWEKDLKFMEARLRKLGRTRGDRAA